MSKRYVSFDETKMLCIEIMRQMYLSEWKPELIIGVTRGGALPAVLLSQMLGVKMVGLDVSLRDNTKYGPETNAWAAEDALAGEKILIVDDINDTGATINWIVNDWGPEIKWGEVVRFATLFDNEASDSKIDVSYMGTTINKATNPEWIVFPWEDFWLPKYE